jgi:excisionase family DNA binding protein
MTPLALTVEEAATHLGITPKAVRRRIERGTLLAVMAHDGRRRIPAAALNGAVAGSAEPRSGSMPRSPGAAAPVEQDGIAILVSRIEALAAENGQLRALTQIAESSRDTLERELHETRARVLELEAVVVVTPPRRRWLRRS